MRKLLGVAFMFCLLGLSLSANKHESYDIYEYDYSDTLDFDTIVVVEEAIADTIWYDDYIICDTIAEEDVIIGITTEDIVPFSPLGESSAALYAGRQFKVKNNDGSEFEFQVNDDGVSVTLIKGLANGTSKLVIPSSVEGLDSYFFVTDIGQFAFKNYIFNDYCPMKNVSHLVISEGVVSVGQNAFDNSPDLEVVDFPSSLEVIPYCMFNDCNKLREVHIPDDSRISNIESFAFARCTSLESFTIPSEVSEIGEGPWRGCTSLQKLSIQEDNYNFIIDEGVLYKGWQGDLVQYPAGKRDNDYQILFGIKTICNSAFYGNPFIERVSIPASVDSISHIAFFDCKSLNQVTFNNVIPFIGNKAFAECPNLKAITLYGTPNYTHEPGDIYNTFSEGTTVSIVPNVPEVKLPNSKDGILTAVIDYVSTFKDFHTGVIEKNEDYGFPDYYGKGRWAVYGNAGPKKDVLNVLSAIPSKFLELENIDEKGRITRLYLDKSNKKNPRLLYFFGGINGNDLVVALFKNGNLKQIEKMIKDAQTKQNYEED